MGVNLDVQKNFACDGYSDSAHKYLNWINEKKFVFNRYYKIVYIVLFNI